MMFHIVQLGAGAVMMLIAASRRFRPKARLIIATLMFAMLAGSVVLERRERQITNASLREHRSASWRLCKDLLYEIQELEREVASYERTAEGPFMTSPARYKALGASGMVHHAVQHCVRKRGEAARMGAAGAVSKLKAAYTVDRFQEAVRGVMQVLDPSKD